MNKTSIEWTDYTWNPIRARRTDIIVDKDGRDANDNLRRAGTFCTRISPGCTNCYASVINKRFGNGLEYTVPNLERVEFFIDEKILEEPLRRKKPARIFVGDMFDLFHEAIPVKLLIDVFARMLTCHWHTFQVLTKRAQYMRNFLSASWWEKNSSRNHIWLGVSVEDQQRADERIPLLLKTPAAVRFLSVEPMLEAIDLDGKRSTGWWKICPRCQGDGSVPAPGGGKPCPTCFDYQGTICAIDWVICGGESGPGARPFNVAWAEKLLAQCRSIRVPFFCKQLGSHPQVHSCRDLTCTHPDCGMEDVHLKDRKGGNPLEWPEVLRIREFPKGWSA